MPSYCTVTVEEMESVLNGHSPSSFIPLSLPGTKELVYGKRVDRGGNPISLRVYTSLDPSGLSRDCGQDAIRVELYFRLGRSKDSKVVRIGGSKRVNRVPGWEDRLLERINNWEDMLGPECPRCSSPMVLRKARSKSGKNNKFYGCCRYPDCRGTSNLITDLPQGEV